MEYLYEALKRAGDRTLHAFPSAVPLVLHSSISYLGFFVNDSPADIIREFAVMFATEASILAGRQPCGGGARRALVYRRESLCTWGWALHTRMLGGAQGSRSEAVPQCSDGQPAG